MQLIKTFEEVNSIKIPIRFVEKRKGDVARSSADNSLAKNIKWEPSRDIKKMCLDGWNFIKNILKRFRCQKDIHLVAGGAGFIGCHLVEDLIKRGTKLFVLIICNWKRRKSKKIYK